MQLKQDLWSGPLFGSAIANLIPKHFLNSSFDKDAFFLATWLMSVSSKIEGMESHMVEVVLNWYSSLHPPVIPQFNSVVPV